MSKVFAELIRNSRHISRDRFATDFGDIPSEVVEMINSPAARERVREARDYMERCGPLPNGRPRLRRLEFGDHTAAPELTRGEVAAVDGTPALPLQFYSSGQALCVGVGSISYRRDMSESMHYWSSKSRLEAAGDGGAFMDRHAEGMYGISQTAYMRYFETRHALEIEEAFILLDGTLVYEWLMNTTEGVALYEELFASGKRCAGVIKSLRDNVSLPLFGRALSTGEAFVVETVSEHITTSRAANRNPGEAGARRSVPPIFNQVVRGVFRPAGKAFGFEAHLDHLEDMLRIIAADAQMDKVGHEVPYLLNRVDEEVRRQFSPRMLQNRIFAEMAEDREEMFFEESDERDFR